MRCVRFSALLWLIQVTCGQLKDERISLIFFGQDDLSDDQKQMLRDNYTREMFFTERMTNQDKPHQLLLLDEGSFVFDIPFSVPELKLDIQVHDLGAEEAGTEDDYFADIYKKQAEMDAFDEVRMAHDTELRQGGPTIDIERLKFINRNVFSVPRSFQSSETFRNAVGDFISRRFGSLGLITGFQQFKPSQFKSYFHDNAHGLPIGSNIFGIYPGIEWGSPNDKIIVIGAHWDTMPNTGGFNDNGSGVTAVLEVARILRLHQCKLRNSIVFVAFDMEEVGSQGSLEFLRSFLLPNVVRNFGQKHVSGAIIIDTVLNFNTTVGSQTVSPEMQKLLPHTAASISSRNFKGDFLNVIERQLFDNNLAETFARNWRAAEMTYGNDHQFGLLRSKLHFSGLVPRFDEVEEKLDYLRSDHARFWFINHTHLQSMTSILLTDTGPQRGLMRSCYHSECDSVRDGHNAEYANFHFFGRTVQAIVNTAMELSEATCATIPVPKVSAGMPIANVLSTWAIWLIVGSVILNNIAVRLSLI